jgi:hypothetical protein
MLETHIMISSLIFRLDLILMLCLTLTLMLCLNSLMDLIIAHMVLVHERTALCLDALDTAHVLIVVIVSRIGLIFLWEGFTPVLSQDTWTVHVFPVMVLVPLVQMVMCRAQRGQRWRGWRRLPVWEAAIRQGATGARSAGPRGRDGPAERPRPIRERGSDRLERRKNEWAAAGPKAMEKILFRIKFNF